MRPCSKEVEIAIDRINSFINVTHSSSPELYKLVVWLKHEFVL